MLMFRADFVVVRVGMDICFGNVLFSLFYRLGNFPSSCSSWLETAAGGSVAYFGMAGLSIAGERICPGFGIWQWEQCSHGSKSRPWETCHHECLKAVCGVLGYPAGAAAELF